jgi:hypothetical protein
MPSKRSAAGFTNGEKAYEPFLKAKGWKSEYRSVQKLLNHLTPSSTICPAGIHLLSF